MQNKFTTEELKNISVLIARSNITGAEALSVAVLQQKIDKMMIEVAPPVVERVADDSPSAA